MSKLRYFIVVVCGFTLMLLSLMLFTGYAQSAPETPPSGDIVLTETEGLVVLNQRMILPVSQCPSTINSPVALTMSEDFEGIWPNTGWEVGDGSDNDGGEYTWHKRECYPHTGSYAAWAVGGGLPGGSLLLCTDQYPANAHSWMTYGPFDLTAATAATLDFYIWGKTEGGTNCPYDYLFVGGSSDGDSFDGGRVCGDWTGGDLANGYYTLTLDLESWLGQSTVWVGFIFHSDVDTQDIGFTIDDVALNVTGVLPEVDFVGVPHTGNAPLSVQFTSMVTGTVTDYLWRFGDGGIADTPNPTHTYQNAGRFGVTLETTGPEGLVTVNKPDYIIVNVPTGVPTATFSANLTNGTAPLMVTFTASVSGTVEHWQWDFGDGHLATTGPTVNHTYVTSGTFDVSLTVSNTYGSFSTNKLGYITVRKSNEVEFPEALPPEPHRWQWQHGAVQIESLTFKNTNTGWGVGKDGIILHTTDGGETWQSQESGDGDTFTEIQFVDEDNGWILGGNTLLRTHNGGLTWEVITRTLPANQGIMSFVDAYRGWIAQTDGLLRTTDGGRTWNKQTAGILAPIQDMQFLDATHGFVLCKGDDNMDNSHILRTVDGGQTWTESTCSGGMDCDGLYGFHFPTSNFGIAVGGFVNPYIAYSLDAGVTWQAIETSITFLELEDAFFVDTQSGWAWGEGKAIRTSDGGQTWFELGQQAAVDLYFLTAQRGFKATNYGIYGTTDGGNTWVRSVMLDETNLHAIDFVDQTRPATDGWAVGASGTILHTTDGGASWAQQTTPGSGLLQAVDFVDSMHGWTVGPENTIWATSDGGMTWNVQTTGMDYDLFDVVFVDAMHGWIAGEQNVNKNPNGRVWRTTDGGQTWLAAGNFHAIDQGGHGKYALDFVDQNVGYVVGMEVLNGSIHKTTNGGETWSLLFSGTDYPKFYAVDFINANEGWVVGASGKIYHTTDGGANWVAQASGVNFKLNAVKFMDANTGYVVGAQDVVLYTTDGGQLWQIDTPDYGVPYAFYNYTSIAIPNRFELWVTGNNGTIGKLNLGSSHFDYHIFLPLVLRQ